MRRPGAYLVAFGGIPIKNTFVAPGGMARHSIRRHLAAARRRGMQIAHFSPLRDDVVADAEARWYPLVPRSDVAVMLALAHVLISEDLHDRSFLDRCCHGSERFIGYVLGKSDGSPRAPSGPRRARASPPPSCARWRGGWRPRAR